MKPLGTTIISIFKTSKYEILLKQRFGENLMPINKIKAAHPLLLLYDDFEKMWFFKVSDTIANYIFISVKKNTC